MQKKLLANFVCWGGGEFRIILQLNQVHTYSVPCKDPETIDLLLLIYFVI